MSTDDETSTDERKPFAAFIQEQRGGGLHGELSDALAEVVQAVQETQKPGSVTLLIKIVPNRDGATVTVTDRVLAKAPEGDRGAAIFFIQGAGNLVRRDPRQMELPLREVGKPPELPAADVEVLGGDPA